MLLSTLFILATTVQPSSVTCTQKLRDLELALKDWRASTRTETTDFEQHRYFNVTKDGRTVHLTLIATTVKPAGSKLEAECIRNGAPAAVYFNVRVVK